MIDTTTVQGINKAKKEQVARQYIEGLSLTEFLAILKQDEYRPYLYKKINYSDANVRVQEKYNGAIASFSEVVYEYVKRYDRLPTPFEYSQFNVKAVLNKLAEEGAEITPDLKKALYNRRINAYISFMAEIQARKTLAIMLSNKYQIMASDSMDYMGVDIAVRNKYTNRMAFIHVTSNTPYAKLKAEHKSQMKGRDFTGHLWMFYDKKTLSELADKTLPELSTDTTKEWNGYYFFKKEYIQHIIMCIEDKTEVGAK